MSLMCLHRRKPKTFHPVKFHSKHATIPTTISKQMFSRSDFVFYPQNLRQYNYDFHRSGNRSSWLWIKRFKMDVLMTLRQQTENERPGQLVSPAKFRGNERKKSTKSKMNPAKANGKVKQSGKQQKANKEKMNKTILSKTGYVFFLLISFWWSHVTGTMFFGIQNRFGLKVGTKTVPCLHM